MLKNFKQHLITSVFIGASLLSSCGNPSVPPNPNGPDPKPNIVMPAICTDIPLSYANEVASNIGVNPSLIEKYWNNDDSAFVLTDVHCLTDQEQRFLGSLEDAVSLGIANEDSLLYWLNRFNTVGQLTNEAFDLTARVARDTNTVMPRILATIPYGSVIQPTGNLPGTSAAKNSEGNLFVNYPINPLVNSWGLTSWNISSGVPSTFHGLFIEGLEDVCGAPGQTVTQSMDVLFNPVPGELGAQSTPVFNGALLPAKISGVSYGLVQPGPVDDVRLFITQRVPYDDQSKFVEGNRVHMNLTRAPEWTFAYVHLIKGTETHSSDDVGRIVQPGVYLGDTYANIHDFSVKMPATRDYFQDDIPIVFPRMVGSIPYRQGSYIFDPVMAAHVSEAIASGIPEDLIVALDLPRYRDPAIFYQGTCKPIE